MKKKVLILGALISPLIRERVRLSYKLGYEVLVLDFNSKKNYLVDENIKIKTYFDNKIISKVLTPFILLFNILIFKPNIIHVHWALQDFNILILMWFKNVVVSTMGSDIMPKASSNKFRKFLLILLLKNAKIIRKMGGLYGMPLNVPLKKIIIPGLMLAGDAAGLHGIINGMISAELCADTAIKAIKNGNVSEEILKEYQRKLKKNSVSKVSIGYDMQNFTDDQIERLLNEQGKEITEFMLKGIASFDV